MNTKNKCVCNYILFYFEGVLPFLRLYILTTSPESELGDEGTFNKMRHKCEVRGLQQSVFKHKDL